MPRNLVVTLVDFGVRTRSDYKKPLVIAKERSDCGNLKSFVILSEVKDLNSSFTRERFFAKEAQKYNSTPKGLVVTLVFYFVKTRSDYKKPSVKAKERSDCRNLPYIGHSEGAKRLRQSAFNPSM